jgi:hypothetical protein
VHPALHKGQNPVWAILKDRSMCPVSTVGRPGMLMSQMCINITLFPSGKSIVRGFFAMRLSATLTPSMIKIEVTSVSVIARLAAIVIAFKTGAMGYPTSVRPLLQLTAVCVEYKQFV